MGRTAGIEQVSILHPNEEAFVRLKPPEILKNSAVCNQSAMFLATTRIQPRSNRASPRATTGRHVRAENCDATPRSRNVARGTASTTQHADTVPTAPVRFAGRHVTRTSCALRDTRTPKPRARIARRNASLARKVKLADALHAAMMRVEKRCTSQHDATLVDPHAVC
jgi:hypothetical protein